MSLTKLTADLNIIGGLPDQPTESATQLKEKFDDAGNIIKEYLNNTLTEEIPNEISSSSSSALNTAKNYTNTKISALANGQVATNKNNITSLQSTVSGHTTTINSHTNTINSHTNSINSINQQISGGTKGAIRTQTFTKNGWSIGSLTHERTGSLGSLSIPSGYSFIGFTAPYSQEYGVSITPCLRSGNVVELIVANHDGSGKTLNLSVTALYIKN